MDLVEGENAGCLLIPDYFNSNFCFSGGGVCILLLVFLFPCGMAINRRDEPANGCFGSVLFYIGKKPSYRVVD